MGGSRQAKAWWWPQECLGVSTLPPWCLTCPCVTEEGPRPLSLQKHVSVTLRVRQRAMCVEPGLVWGGKAGSKDQDHWYRLGGGNVSLLTQLGVQKGQILAWTLMPFRDS